GRHRPHQRLQRRQRRRLGDLRVRAGAPGRPPGDSRPGLPAQPWLAADRVGDTLTMTAMADRAVSLTHAVGADASAPAQAGSEPYQAENVLDRLSGRDTLQVHY